jgi:hypothetical protein
MTLWYLLLGNALKNAPAYGPDALRILDLFFLCSFVVLIVFLNRLFCVNSTGFVDVFLCFFCVVFAFE